MRKIDGLMTSQYGITLARKCAYCTRLLYQSAYKGRGRFAEDSIFERKLNMKTREIRCDEECKQLDYDERTVQKRIRDYERNRINYQLKKKNK